jgi:hypothetical protein
VPGAGARGRPCHAGCREARVRRLPKENLVTRHTHLLARCLGAALASTLVLATVLVAAPTNARVPRTPYRFTAKIEPLAGYSPQRTCSPTAKPGTSAFANMLLRTYPSSTSLGIVRACSAGGTSEHKEGRAFDWGVSIHSAADRRAVNSLMRWLLKPDRFGNRYAMARRLGIQYMIWNRRIWGSYSASSGWRRYSGASPHTDHVHFSLSWAGARKQTTFWRKSAGRRLPVPDPAPKPSPQPSPTPSPKPAPKRPSSLPEPTAPATLAAGSPLVSESVRLPAGRRGGVTTTGALQAGREYLVEVAGTYKYASHARSVADGECSTAPRSDWQRDRSIRGDEWLDHLDVYIDGNDLFADSDNGQECDTETHTYRWVYDAERTGRVPLRIWDPAGHGNNSGALTVSITDLGRVRDRMTWQVSSRAAAGVTSPGSLRAGTEYDVTISGTWRPEAGSTSDAECTITAADPVWRRNRDREHDVLLDKSDKGFDAVPDTGGNCSKDDHVYRYTFTPSETRPVNIRVGDDTFGNNAGALTVKVSPHVEPEPEPLANETLKVDARAGGQTAQSYPAGARLRVWARGTYMYRSAAEADAECASRYGYWANHYGGSGDLGFTGGGSTWVPVDGGTCDASHLYYQDVTVQQAGPLRFWVSGLASDTSGSLDVMVEVR